MNVMLMPLAMAAIFFSTGILTSISEAVPGPQDWALNGASNTAEGLIWQPAKENGTGLFQHAARDPKPQ